MSDGVLKSDPDGIWNYYVLLNKNREYIEEAIKDIQRAFEVLEQRLSRKRDTIADRLAELERDLKFLIGKKSRAKDQKEELETEISIQETKKRIKKLEECNEEILRIQRNMEQYVRKVEKEGKKCFKTFSRAKRILNAYLKMVEVEAARTEMCEYGYSGIPGRYGVMEYRNTTFYCDGSAFAPTSDNITLMEQGKAPIGYDGQPVELHHMIQSESGSIIEISGSQHRINHKALHINTPDIPSGIDRSSFGVLRNAYWKRRADILKKGL